jgi:hypothetical protein
MTTRARSRTRGAAPVAGAQRPQLAPGRSGLRAARPRHRRWACRAAAAATATGAAPAAGGAARSGRAMCSPPNPPLGPPRLRCAPAQPAARGLPTPPGPARAPRRPGSSKSRGQPAGAGRKVDRVARYQQLAQQWAGDRWGQAARMPACGPRALLHVNAAPLPAEGAVGVAYSARADASTLPAPPRRAASSPSSASRCSSTSTLRLRTRPSACRRSWCSRTAGRTRRRRWRLQRPGPGGGTACARGERG